MAETGLLQASAASQPVEHRTLSMLGNSLTLIAGKLATGVSAPHGIGRTGEDALA